MHRSFIRAAMLVLSVILLMSMGVMVVSSADDTWQASYYNNTNLSGTPVLTNNPQAVDFNWGTNGPGNGVNTDNFSARWVKTTNLAAGRYRLTLTSDDGSRVFVNNRLVTNQWWDHDIRTASGEYNHGGGAATIRVEYYEKLDKAVISFKMERIGSQVQATATPWPKATVTWVPGATATPNWVPGATATPRPVATSNPNSGLTSCSNRSWFGNYWNNKFLAGAPAASRNVGHVNFNWGEGRPLEGINADNWSASWTTTYDLAKGNYRFTLTSDDGSTLWVNNWQFINLWYDHTARTTSRTYNHPGGPVTVRIEYYDSTGPAIVAFSCSRIADTNPNPQPAATATPRPAQPVQPVQPVPTAIPPTPRPTLDPLQTANEGECIISKVSYLNVRSAPSLDSAIVTTVARGEVTVLTGNRSGAWVQIRTNEGEIGWINNYYCGAGEPAREPESSNDGTDHVCAVEVDALVIRSGPGTGYNYVGVAYRGDPMRLAGQRNAAGTWVTVIHPDGTRGWVFAQYIGVPQSVINQLSVSG